ncbi:hypothetical protein [Geobacillus sp. PK12]|uniref:hypothetical protein n=1 Tax=Geobacillus sp. PK12 TaxID=2508525 RepID=UPI001013AC35|nr:hypothetical protein [Geobacillus sp. PK12]RXS89210.1 hypothetical protein ETR37_07620 [Geobacillus sp. PK12]
MIIKMYRISFLSLLFFTFVFLTGSLYGINLKILFAFVSALSLAFIWLSKNTPINYINLLLFVSFISLVTLAAFMGVLNGFRASSVLDEFIGVLSPLIILGLYNSNFISISAVKKTMLVGATIYSFSKVSIALLISIEVISFPDFYKFVEEAFGYQFMSMPILPEYKIIRIYAVNDLLITFSPLLLFNKDMHLSKLVKFFIYIIFCLSMFLSYSRFLILLFMIVSLLSIATLKITTKKVLIIFYSLCLCGIYLLMFGIPKMITDRFLLTNHINIQSDTIRSTQFDFMIDMISKHKIIGAGLGSHIPNFIRSDISNYVYELQWMSLIFKFGFPIFIFICLIILIYFRNNFIFCFKSVILFLSILSSGIFNPYLESTVMGACLLLLHCNYGKRKDRFPLISDTKSRVV